MITFRQSEIASISFPLKLQSVTQVDSKTSPAVQLADVMIGAAIEAANALTGQFAALQVLGDAIALAGARSMFVL